MNANHQSVFKSVPVRRHDGDDAFTLTELLVVLATLAILSVLLLPALASTQSGNSKAFQCLNNMRQMAVAWTLYAEDNQDRLVNNFGVSSIQADLAANPPIYRSWVCDIMDWTTVNSYVTNLDAIWKAPFNNYVGGSVSVYKCPADNYLSGLQRAAGWTARPRSYSMNGYCGPYNPTWTSGANPFYPTYRQFLKTGTIPNPSNLYVFLEEHPDSINDGYFHNNADPNISDWNPPHWSDLPGSNHAGFGGFSFADGHSEIHKWQSTVCTILPVKMGPFPQPLFSTDPSGAAAEDAQWLASHSSVLR
jgi:prepilin-type N-terminal cleavage/methylation domain-containing protein